MNVILTILLVIAAIVVLFFIVALMTKKEFTLQRQVIINRAKQDVFDYMKLIKTRNTTVFG